MVVITRQGSPMRNREIDDAAVQSDVRDFLPNFLPTHGSQQIMIFAPPKEEAEGNTIASGKLESGDSFVVSTARSVSRNIWFTSSVCMPCTCANTPANCRRHTAKNAGFFAHRLYTATPHGPSTFFTSSKKPFYTSTTTAAPTLKNGIGGNDVFSPGSFASMSTNR